MPESGVEVVWSALSRAWRKAEYAELWVQFRPYRSKDVLEAVKAAVEVANQHVEEAGWGDVVFTEGVSDSDAGPVAMMSRAGPEEGVRAWLGAFAHHLEGVGLAGKVTAAPQAHFPDWLSGDIEVPQQLNAFVSYRTIDLGGMDEEQRGRGWHVPSASTLRITDAGVAWGSFAGADVYLLRDIHQIRTKNLDMGGPLADGIIKYGMAGVTYLRSEPRRMASLELFIQGQACYMFMDDSLSWQERLEKVLRAMVAFPEDTDLAFVQYSNANGGWGQLDTASPPPPYVREYHVRYNRHLNSGYIPDAHGLQLLTNTHLAHANDLSDWVIEPIGGGRNLVQARDLSPWYSNVNPDPETLMKARADFGKMILTPETIANNPPPWP